MDEDHRLQQVVSVAERVRVTDWMATDFALHGKRGLFGRTVDFFPSLFRSPDRRINRAKARDWWDKRAATTAKLVAPETIKYASDSQRQRRQFAVKALDGRGRKLGEHWKWLYPLLLVEFQHLRRAGVKLSNLLVADIATVLVEESDHPVFNFSYNDGGKAFTAQITARRVQDFLECFNIVYKRHKGKKQVSDEKQQEIDKAVAKHLGGLKRQFEEGSLDPEQQYNMDESHFVIDLDDGKTLDFSGANIVKYLSIVSGREGITMCVLLKGGSDARILCPMLIFKNAKANYPMQGLLDDRSTVTYRTSASAFTNGRLMQDWLREPRFWGPGGPFTNQRTLWMDNASGHYGDEVGTVAKTLRTSIKLLPPNATDKIQPADRFPIQRIKEHWRQLCEKRNTDVIRRGE